MQRNQNPIVRPKNAGLPVGTAPTNYNVPFRENIGGFFE